MELQEGLRLLEEALQDCRLANLKRSGFGNKRIPKSIEDEVERELNSIYIRVEGIMKTCPQIETYIDHNNIHFSRVFWETDLPSLIDAIKADIK